MADPWAGFETVKPAGGAGADPWAGFQAVDAEPEPSAFDRLMSGVGQYLNPVKIVRDMGEMSRPVNVPAEFGQAVEAFRGGDYGQAARHAATAAAPFVSPALVPAARIAQSTVDASSGQLIKAYDAAAEGEYAKAVGHGLGAVPIFGPMGAAAGERVASGDMAGGIGEGLGALGSVYLPVGAAKVAPAAGRAAAATGRAIARHPGAVAGTVAGGATLATTGNPLMAAGAASTAAATANTIKALATGGPEAVAAIRRALQSPAAVAEAAKARGVAIGQARAAEISAARRAAAEARNAPEVAAFDAAKAAAQARSAASRARNAAAVEARYAPQQAPAAVAPEAAPAPAAVVPEAAPVVAEAAAPVQARPIPPGAHPVPMTPSRGGLPPGLATQLDQEMAARQAAAAPVESPKWWQEWAANEVAVTRAQIAELKQAPPTPKTEAAIAQRVKYAEGLIRDNPGLLAQVPDVPGPGPRRFVGSDPGYPVPRESWVPPGNGVPPAAAPAAPAAPAPAAAEAPRALPAEAVTLAQQIESSAANMIQNTGLSGAQMVQALVEEYRIPPNAAQAMLAEVQKVYQRPGTIPGQGPPLSSAPQRGATQAQLAYRGSR